MKCRLVIWDFDGTLADTLTLALQIYNRLAAEKRYLPIDDPQLVRDMSMREFLKAHRVPLHHVPLAFRTFLKELRKRSSGVRLHQGVEEAVRQLAASGVRQGIISSNSTENIRSCLSNSGLMKHFELLQGTSRLFGKESRIRKAVRQLDIPLNEVIYVGDEIRDIESARAAGVRVASVTWGLNSAHALSSHSPDQIFDEPHELVEWITNDSAAT